MLVFVQQLVELMGQISVSGIPSAAKIRRVGKWGTSVRPAKTYYTRPRRRRWKQLVLTSWLSVGAMRDDRRRRLTAATGREGPGAGVLHAAL